MKCEMQLDMILHLNVHVNIPGNLILDVNDACMYILFDHTERILLGKTKEIILFI